MQFGLPPQTLELIINCIVSVPQIVWVKVYGSRATNNFRAGSDLDLAYSATEDITAKLKAKLELLPTPYLFDIIHYEEINSSNLKENIDLNGQILFTKTQ